LKKKDSRLATLEKRNVCQMREVLTGRPQGGRVRGKLLAGVRSQERSPNDFYILKAGGEPVGKKKSGERGIGVKKELRMGQQESAY